MKTTDKTHQLTETQAFILDRMLDGGSGHTGRRGHSVPAMKALERAGFVRKGVEHLWETDWHLTSTGLALAREREAARRGLRS